MRRVSSPLLVTVAAAALAVFSSCGPPDQENAPAGAPDLPPATQFTFDEAPDRDAAWSPDGRWISFGSQRSGNEDIWKKPVEGGDPVQLTTDPATDLYAVWSPDGQRLCFISDRGGTWNIWTVSAEGGDARQVTTEVDSVADPQLPGSGPSWSPDGRHIAFTSVRGQTVGGDIWIIPAEGGLAYQFTHDPGQDTWPAWSPDGEHIAFSSNRAGTPDIWVMPVAGGPARQVTDSPAWEMVPGWSPDGAWLAYSSRPGQADFSQTSLWIVPAEGGVPAQLIDPTASGLAAFVPRWSPDNTSIAFNAAVLVARESELCVMAASGGEPRVVMDRVIGGFDGPATWSPDGQWIAFAADGIAGWDLWKIPSDGGEPVQLTQGGAVASGGFVDVCWSPDGRRLAFTSQAEEHRAVSTVSAEGGAPRRVSVGETDHIWMDWSPDGRRIAYSDERAIGDWDLWIVPAAGGKAEALTALPAAQFAPTWSPDGEHLAFASGVVGISLDTFGICRLPLEGGEPMRLADGWSPNWSPDGRWILYVLGWDLWKVPADGGRPSPVLQTADVGEFWPRWSPDGSQILFTRTTGGGAREGNIWIADVRKLVTK